MVWMESLRTWFTSLGWIADAITVTGFIGALAIAFRKHLTDLLGLRSFDSLKRSRVAIDWTPEIVKSLATVAVVDDNPDDFPIAQLKRDGFQVKTYKHVRLADFAALAAYDVVLLDMHGVVSDDIETGGLKLISRLRATTPTQKICAVSSKTFDPTATTFFRQADDVQRKPMTAQQCRDVVLKLAMEKLDPASLARTLDQQTAHLTRRTRATLVRRIDTFAAGSKPSHDFKTEPNQQEVSLETKARLIDLIRVIRHARK